VAPEGRGGKHGRNEYGKPKFPFSNIVVESSIGLVCPSGLQQNQKTAVYKSVVLRVISANRTGNAMDYNGQSKLDTKTRGETLSKCRWTCNQMHQNDQLLAIVQVPFSR